METKLEILKMLEAGTITAAEAEALLEAMEAEKTSDEDSSSALQELTALRDECRELLSACERARENCEAIKAECESLRGECEDFMQEAEDYASDAEDYAAEAEEYAENCPSQESAIDWDALDSELGQVQAMLESLGIQGVDFSRIRKTAVKVSAARRAHGRDRSSRPHPISP